MIPLNFTEIRQWARALTDFDGAFATVQANLAALERMRAEAPRWPAPLRTEYAALYRKGRAAYAQLLKLKATRDTVRAWIAKLVGLAKSAVGLSQLGVLPLIYVAAGLAAFVAAIAAARSFLADSQGFARRHKLLVETADQLIQRGLSPAEAYSRAAEIAARTAGEADAPGTVEKLGMRALWIAAIIGGLYFVLPKLLPAARRRALS